MYRLIAVIALVSMVGCQKKQPAPADAPAEQPAAAATAEGAPAAPAEKPAQPSKVDGAKAKELVKNGATLLDVRTQGEWDGGHIEGAKHIAVQELGGKIGDVGAKDKAVVVYCASGIRSARAASMLSQAGFKEVYDLGGMGNW